MSKIQEEIYRETNKYEKKTKVREPHKYHVIHQVD